jgi:hypothetical protein
MNKRSIEYRLEKYKKVLENGCWVYTGRVGKSGYGYISYKGTQKILHRLVWELTHGTIGTWRQQVCHKCDNRLCYNPDHLFLGTNAENQKDKANKGRAARLQGIKNGRRVLTNEQVLEIRSLYELGMTQADLMRKYGVAQSLIWRIVRRKAWNHI